MMVPSTVTTCSRYTPDAVLLNDTVFVGMAGVWSAVIVPAGVNKDACMASVPSIMMSEPWTVREIPEMVAASIPADSTLKRTS